MANEITITVTDEQLVRLAERATERLETDDRRERLAGRLADRDGWSAPEAPRVDGAASIDTAKLADSAEDGAEELLKAYVSGLIYADLEASGVTGADTGDDDLAAARQKLADRDGWSHIDDL